MASPPLAPGDVVCGEFTITRALGEDPLTAVYEATSARRPGETFSVRAASVGRARSAGAVAAFRKQMAALETYEHAAIPPVLDFELTEGAAVLVTRATGLRTLRQWLDAGEGGPGQGMLARVILGVASALASLHRRATPVTHGLLCPETIEATPGGDARLQACGFVHALVSAKLLGRLDVVHRAPGYLSPGALRNELRPRDDTFVLASVAFECLTGQLPFQGPDRESVLIALTDGPRPSAHGLRPELPADLDGVFSKAWSVEAGTGYASIIAFARDLEDALATPARRPTVRSAPAARERTSQVPAPSVARAPTPGAPRASPPSRAPSGDPLPPDADAGSHALAPSRARSAWIVASGLVLAAGIETASRVLPPLHREPSTVASSGPARCPPMACPPTPTCPAPPAPRCPPRAPPPPVEPCPEPPAPVVADLRPERSEPPSNPLSPSRPTRPSVAPSQANAESSPRPEDLARMHAAQAERVRRCLTADSPRRHIRLALTYDRATGRVLTARLGGAYASRPEAGCILEAARASALPSFGQGRWEHRWALEVGPGGLTPRR